MTYELYNDWIQASKSVSAHVHFVLCSASRFLSHMSVISLSVCSIQDQDKRLQALLSACEKLPPANNNNFK